MDIVTGALPDVVKKLGELLVGEYNLQKGVKGEIRFLQSELESMQGALEKVSNTPVGQLDVQHKSWARELRELSYDIEDTIDTFMVRGDNGNEQAKLHGIRKFIDRSVGLFRKAKMRHGIATEIRDIRSRVEEVSKRHDRYKINTDVAKPVKIDPRLYGQYEKVTQLVGIEEAREELIKKTLLSQESQVSMQQHGTIVSIVGFGGMGKTTLANAVYEKIRAQFDCCAFASVSQTPDFRTLFKGMLNDLGKNINGEASDENRLIKLLREFLQEKRYFIVIDDIWDISAWKTTRCALPDNNVGYTIITTTRISHVAEYIGGAYKLKPLSPNNSKKLLYRRIFGNENKGNNEDIEKCPNAELAEVSDRILKKCAGVPLAIITMAGLLACKPMNKMEWYEVYNSVGTGLENNLDMENMRKILSFSYYELPCHLKTCLLYLSMFPEDFEIEKDRLIRMWIGEGFIQCEKRGKRLYELGESYFNELINRSMIQPIYHPFHDTVTRCRVHDMVLDLICSLSTEENFVTTINDLDRTFPLNMVRRLSIQNGNVNHVMAQDTRRLQQVRSLVVFQYAIALAPPLGSFRVLRVLDLEDCNLSQASGLKYLGNLIHLRYLRLCGTRISQLPEEVRNMPFLQTLDISGNKISCLPSTFVQLRNLMCLCIHRFTRVPNGIGNLTCLEQLTWLGIDNSTINIIEELGQLTELRKLDIELDKWNDKLLECLPKLQKIQDLTITVQYGRRRNIGGLDPWVAPQYLRSLTTQSCCWFSMLPVWMKPSHLPDLTSLEFAVRELQQDKLEIIGRLPALRSLYLEVNHKNLGIMRKFTLGSGSFPCLVRCYFVGFVGPVVFRQGAMPRVRQFVFDPIYVQEAREITSSDGGFELGLGNLPSLQDVRVMLRLEGACKEEAKQAEAALTRAAEVHPNHPTHSIYVDCEGDGSGSDSDEDE